MRVAWFYDMDACRWPTGVTRHALAQLAGLRNSPDVEPTAVSGRLRDPDGLAAWEALDDLRRRELPLRARDMLRAWRLVPGPPLELWTGPVDWVYCPAEFFVPTRRAKLAVTSHDVLQDLRHGSRRRNEHLRRVFAAADLILSVSRFNTERLIEAFPVAREKTAHCPNGAEDLFFEPATDRERVGARVDLGLPAGLPYLLSVANFQPRKNLDRLVRAAVRLPEVASGDLGLVLLGAAGEAEARALESTIDLVGKRAVIRRPGYRQGKALRAIYAEATALVFPSLCESFGIPAVEAMAQGTPVALANSTALPEIGGEAGWYFDPEDESAITASLRDLLGRPNERAHRVSLGRTIARGYGWERANGSLVEALASRT